MFASSKPARCLACPADIFLGMLLVPTKFLLTLQLPKVNICSKSVLVWLAHFALDRWLVRDWLSSKIRCRNYIPSMKNEKTDVMTQVAMAAMHSFAEAAASMQRRRLVESANRGYHPPNHAAVSSRPVWLPAC